MVAIAELCILMADASIYLHSHSKPPDHKDILVSLTRVQKQLRRFNDDKDDDEQKEDLGSACLQKSCPVHSGQQSGSEINCLTDIVSTMVFFLGMGNKFVQHLAGNILITFSDLLQVDQLNIFLHLLWITLEAAIIRIAGEISPSLFRSVNLTDQHCLNCLIPIQDPNIALSFIASLQSKRAGLNSVLIVGVLRCLRNIKKSFKHMNSDTQGVYVRLALLYLSDIPARSLIEVFLGCDSISEIDSHESLVYDKKKYVEDQKTILLGAVLQFLCSLIDQNYFEDVKHSSPEEFNVPSKCRDLIFIFLTPLLQHLNHCQRSISLYIRHKALMLMIRMSLHLQWLSLNLVSCLKLLQDHFSDLLYAGISDDRICLATCLEESPFLASLDGDREQNLSTRHLQRQATYLFFHYCLRFACFRDECALECLCATKSQRTKVCSEKCDFMALFELFEWLQRCTSLENIADCTQYHKACCNFALSFLQLYIEEDDLLFHMLLLLHDVSSITLQRQGNEIEASFESRRMDVYFHISSFFNAIHLFHLFLFLLHYDHLVLVDYLISNDMGIQFLRYLLRSLRVICKSWHTFANFSASKNEMHQQCFKKRKFLETSCASSMPSSSLHLVTDRSTMSKGDADSTYKMANLQAYENAKDCLLSLKRTVEDLHSKNLFPYNPKPLLRSFVKFEEQCMQHRR